MSFDVMRQPWYTHTGFSLDRRGKVLYIGDRLQSELDEERSRQYMEQWSIPFRTYVPSEGEVDDEDDPFLQQPWWATVRRVSGAPSAP